MYNNILFNQIIKKFTIPRAKRALRIISNTKMHKQRETYLISVMKTTMKMKKALPLTRYFIVFSKIHSEMISIVEIRKRKIIRTPSKKIIIQTIMRINKAKKVKVRKTLKKTKKTKSETKTKNDNTIFISMTKIKNLPSSYSLTKK